MAVDVPVTIWRPEQFNSEMGMSDSADLTTLSGLSIVTLSGNHIVIDEGTTTPIPASVWEEDDSQ